MTPITVTRAHDVPDLRLWMVDAWEGPFRNLEAYADLVHPHDTLSPKFSRFDTRFDLAALYEGSLWWVTADMVELIAHAAKTLPPTTLTDDLVPDEFGLVVLETPLQGLDAEGTDGELEVRAFLWGPALLRYDDARYLGISLYADQKGMWAPLGRTDWEYGADTEAMTTAELSGDEARLASMAEDRRWFAALCLLLASSSATHEQATIPRAVARRSKAAKSSPDSAVKIVDVLHRQSGGSGGSGEREYSHRWFVDGHWRQQAYGPAHSLRRPTWINPHVRGPEGKPLVPKDTVRVVR